MHSHAVRVGVLVAESFVEIGWVVHFILGGGYRR
jgi:hypothetical protein